MRWRAALGLFLGLLTGLAQAAGAPGGRVKIGFLGALSGPFAIWGLNARDGMRMAVSEVNQAGGLLGQPVELVERDDRNNPAEAIGAFRFLVEREGVAAVGGVISSDVALALSREAETLRVPLFLTMAGSHAILRRNSRFTFRTCLVSAPMFVEAVATYIEHRRMRGVGAVVADYAWGHAVREALEQQLRGKAGVRLQVEVAPVAVSDFTPYLRRLQQLDPDIIVATGHPPGQPVLVRQSAELGMRAVLVGSTQVPEVMVQRAGDAVFGRFLDYSCGDFTSRPYRELARKYFKEYRRHFESAALSGYGIVWRVVEAVRKSGRADGTTVADVTRSTSVTPPGYGFPLAYTEWGELREARPVFFTIERGEPSGEVCPGCGWAQRYAFRSPRLQPYVPGQ